MTVYFAATMNKSLLAATLALMSVACSKPQDHVIPAELSAWQSDTGLQESIKKLPEEEKKLVAAWMLRFGMAQALGAKIPEGTTIGAAIEAQRKFAEEQAAKEAAEKALAEKVARERAEAEARMNAVITFAMVSVDFYEANFMQGVHMPGFNLAMAFENKSPKDLAGIKGTVVIKDMFGDHVKSLGVSIDTAIGAGQVLNWKGAIDFNQFIEEDKKLRSTPLEKMKATFVPKVFIFADGTRMEAP